MERQYIISIDIGTSSCKTALFDDQGQIVCIASKEHQTFFGELGAVDQNPDEWWNCIVQTVRQVMNKSGIEARNIAVIGVDSQSSSVIPMDKKGNVLHNAMIWTDRRAVKERKWIDQELGQEQLTKINGNHNDESNAAPKILWFKNDYPSLYKDTYKIVNAAGYLVYRLTGVFSCNISEGGLTQLFDIQKGVWSKELTDTCGIDIHKMPDIYQCFEIAGKASKESAEQMGILAGTPVVAGSMDAVACGLGCGIIQKGDAFITGGTVTAVGLCTDQPIRNDSLHVYHHIVPNTWCNVAGVDYGGGNYRWFRDEFMQEFDASSVYTKMNQMAEEVPVGADKLLFLPTTVGQRCPQWDGNMKGVYFGITPKHGRKHLIRAIMEGNAFAVREIVELMEKEGAVVENLMIAGGIAKSEVWMKIFKDVLGKPLYLAMCEEATAMGNMMNAAYGVGIINTFVQAKKYCSFQSVPSVAKDHVKYNRLYEVYQSMYPSLKSSFQKLADI